MQTILNHLSSAPVLVVDVFFLGFVIAAARYLRRITTIYMLFVLPGTCAHELAHFLVAFVSNGRPRFPSIIPQRTGSGWLLGSVKLGNARWYNAAIIAFAPLLLLPISVWLYINQIARISLLQPQHWLYLYAAIVMFMSALPSAVDLRLAWRYSASLVVACGLGLLGYVLVRLS